MANQKNTDASIKNLETQVGQIAKQLEEKYGGTFTATTQPNPKEHCKAITTRIGKILNENGDENEKKERSFVGNREEEEKKRKEEEKGEKNNKGEIVEKEQEKKGGNEKETNEGKKSRRTRKKKEK
ncbi:UPF0329 protein ECU05_1680/ECU11_0050-like [Lathyrus oleraceus]|uniref:UPF0329 protein ECU05_1680/ECU11_0050-like n=1 Tax=Pisum sativum TaxID=3888 RepID=UPI0021D2A3C8|nr:UPF0329 protein ECU05_1680/ECU11_0050-like [Pisum sativum]